MATQLVAGKNCTFQKLQIIKAHSLGTGSFGTVYQARGDQLPCAAKLLHFAKIRRTGHRDEMQRIQTQFEQKCQFLLSLHHPNIVHCLGIFADRESGFPAIFLELMDENLTHFLERLEDQLPYHLEINFFYDITLALAYLHSNGIIHRNLTSNNVLLIAGNRAKISDFGMYKIPELSHVAPSPRLQPYLPPETFKSPPTYTIRGDCFSLGVLGIQIMTRAYPNPAPSTKPVKDPLNPTKKVQGAILEADRRKTHIDLVNPVHPLLSLALRCISYEERDRPAVPEVCRELATLKGSPQYNKSVHNVEKEKEILESTVKAAEKLHVAAVSHASKSHSLENLMEYKDQDLEVKQQQLIAKETALAAKSRDVQRLKRENLKMKEENSQLRYRVEKTSKELQEREEAVLEKHREVLQLRQQLTENTSVVKAKETEIQQLKHHKHTEAKPEGNNIRLTWRKAPRAPCKMSSGSSAVLASGKAYFRSSGSSLIYQYDPEKEEWERVAECFLEYFALVVIQGELTAIGGKQDGAATNVLLSLTNVGSVQAWAECFPPMPTKRYYVAVVCTGQLLVVAGGWGESGRLSTVELMDTKTLQWFTVASLPQRLSMATALVCKGNLYVIGGLDEKGVATNTIYTCSTSQILRSSAPPRASQASPSKSSSGPQVWYRLADMPVYESTCTTFCDEILAIGGRNSDYNPTPAVYVYNSTANSWEVISAMLMARYRCLVAAIADDTLMVVGSHTSFGVTDVVEFGFIL